MDNERWERRVFEKYLDLMLAEELTCNPAFNRWFLEQAVFIGALPNDDPIDVAVEVSHEDCIAHE